MKKLLGIGLILILIISFFTLPSTATSGILIGIIEIYTPEDLMKIGNDPDWPLDGHYVLMNDLIFTKDSTQQSNFKPIASSYVTPFKGVFDGNGKVIRGLTAQNDDEAVALFFIIDGEDAVIKNLGLEDIDFYGTRAAAIAIYFVRGLIENCYSTGKVDGFYDAGGIAASVIRGKISNCYSRCRISAPNYSGGITSTLEAEGIISRSFFSGNISGFSNVGGIVGINYGLIERSHFSGNLDRKIYRVPTPSFDGPRGGIAGANMSTGVVINCFSSGIIEGGQIIGGIVGANSGEITKCYSTSKLKSSSNNYFLRIAGIAGNNSGKVDRNISIVPEITVYINLSGRVTGNKSDGEYKDVVNLAWNEIKLTIANLPFHNYDVSSFESSFNEENIMNGYFISSKDLKSQETYECLGWSFSGKDPIWEFSGEYAFPKLVGVGGQERLGVIPEEVLVEENIIEIYSPEDLMKIGNDPDWPLDAHYILMNDISFIKEPQQSNFTPIPSTRENPFKGIFDGNGNVIRGLMIKNADSSATLFRYIDGENAVVKDLGLEDIDFYGSSAAGIASVLVKGSIENCYTTGVIFGRSTAGGIVASLLGTIKNSYSSCEITSQGAIGGIAALSAETAIISKCFFDGSISCISSFNTGGQCGGIVGFNFGLIERSYFSGSVTRKTDKFYMTNPSIGAGGISGENYGIIVNCFSIGKVTGDEYVGGIVGNNFGEITKCYSVSELGSSPNSSATAVAGIAGINSGRVDKNIAAVSNIMTGYFRARIMGSNYFRESEIVANYAWGNVWQTENGNLLNGSSIGLTSFKSKVFYERLGWNFSGEDPIWEFSGVYTLPKLVGVGGQERLVIPSFLR